ncbi:hypothetical protein [Sphingomonas sp. NPDC079357]|uniref:hypothetical protein n=1 Tax=Sphingomonas sp. NPDC079357 TaxID=3364518 RepID=UPI00384B864E
MATPFGFAGARTVCFVLASMDARGGAAALDAIAMIGGDLTGHLALQEAPVALVALPDPAPVAIVDLDGAPDELAHDVVAIVAMLAQAQAWRCVVAMSVAQIDLVIAALGDAAEDVHLLCTPDQAEWIGTLAVAAASGAGSVRAADEDREQLARLSAEVARIAEMLTRMSTRDAGSRAEDRRRTFALAETTSDISATDVRNVLRARRLRDRFFGDGLFEDPAWDMLLDLFAARLEGTRVSVSSLCIAAAVAPTTALRWISKLTAARLLVRAPDPQDGRRAFVTLSHEAGDAMHRYVTTLAEARLPLV